MDTVGSILDNAPSGEQSASSREEPASDGRDRLYRDMFHASAVSAWHLDTKGLIPIFMRLQERGISDLNAYAKENRGFAREAQEAMQVIDVNDETLRLFGAPNRAAIVGKPLSRFWIEGRSDTFIDCINGTYAGRSAFRSETWLRTLDGREIYVLFTKAEATRLQDAGEALLSIVDLTDQFIAKKALEEAQAKLAHAARQALFGEVTASVAHEVNQPMTAITTYGAAGLRWLRHAVPDVMEIRDALTNMIEAAGRASEVIARIQAMATPVVIDQRPVCLNDIVIEAIKLLAPNLVELDVDYTLSLSVGLPLITGDSVQLTQVIINLALNAGQAMEGSSTRELLIRTSTLGTDHVQLDLEDTGPGIAPGDRGRIFESFFTTKASGMGLGLGICRVIVNAHGGTIALDHRPGGGVRATLIIPTIRTVEA